MSSALPAVLRGKATSSEERGGWGFSHQLHLFLFLSSPAWLLIQLWSPSSFSAQTASDLGQIREPWEWIQKTGLAVRGQRAGTRVSSVMDSSCP